MYKPRCHVLILVVIRKLVHVLDDLVDAHPEEVSNGCEHSTRHLTERFPRPGAGKWINTESFIVVQPCFSARYVRADVLDEVPFLLQQVLLVG